ncbi:acylphosphatase [Mariprofundus sp. EBB-1]|uniref:acylphosphatase n=1 Tax=Mariprofundus sp. EBB-1 TaxID=2650971 RepID=UPI000EF19F65|nr:acylphosphatase [Mariprofundus sp. EBB-1]RLL52705.1 acylphosphatase [Mariprofundus sp. EBB-1]
MSERGLLVHLHGRVQGVGFRYHARLKARELGLRGWVRNRADGSVECCICGDALPMQAMQDWLRRGPVGASVDAVTFVPLQITGSLSDFSVRDVDVSHDRCDRV